MTKPCAHCGADFTARSSAARFCSTKCRSAAGYRRRTGHVPPTLTLAPQLEDDPLPTDGTLTAVTERDLRALGAEHSIGGTLALLLARAIDTGGFTGSGLTALSREYRVVMAEIKAAAAPPVESPLDRIRRARDARRATGEPT